MDAAPGPSGQSHDTLEGLPAAYHQQVMSPNSGAAQAIGHREEEHARPNGVSREARTIAASEPEYERVLGTGTGATLPTGSDAARVDSFSGTVGRPTGSGDVDSGADGAGRDDMQQAASRMSRVGTEVFRSPQMGRSERRDASLFPHAEQHNVAVAAGLTGGRHMWPSPLPSPTTRSMDGDEGGSVTSGNMIAQQGAAAMKWLSKLGEFVQRRVSQQTRAGEQTTVLQETVWSPRPANRRERSEQEPLFDPVQGRRLQEMAMSAPQLYGAVSTAVGGGSDSSRSFSKEQLEMEVRRQVEQAMEQQKSVAEENQKLKLEVERLRAQAARSDSQGLRSTIPGLPRPGITTSDTQPPVDGALEGNLAGLPGHGREHGGRLEQYATEHVSRGNPGALWVHDGGQGGDRALSLHGERQGNALGPQGRESERLRDERELPEAYNVLEGNPEGLRRHDVRGGEATSVKHGALGGNLPGLSGHGRGHGGGSTRARSQSPQRSNFLGFSERYGISEGNPPVDRAVNAAAAPLRTESGAASDNVLGGNLAGLPGHGREHGGRLFSNVSGIYSGPYNDKSGIYSGPPPGLSGVHGGEPAAEGHGQQQGGAMDPLQALVQGMSQLQAAMALQQDRTLRGLKQSVLVWQHRNCRS